MNAVRPLSPATVLFFPRIRIAEAVRLQERHKNAEARAEAMRLASPPTGWSDLIEPPSPEGDCSPSKALENGPPHADLLARPSVSVHDAAESEAPSPRVGRLPDSRSPRMLEYGSRSRIAADRLEVLTLS